MYYIYICVYIYTHMCICIIYIERERIMYIHTIHMISYDHIYVCSLYQAVNDRLHWRCTACCLAVDLLPHVRMSQK